MSLSDTLEIKASGEREIVLSRMFAAPRELVFKGLTDPSIVQQWLLGPDGWTMPICEIDPKPGGALRYVWRKTVAAKETNCDPKTVEMGLHGVFIEIDPPARIVHTELFDEDWTGGEAIVTTVLTEEDAGTKMTMTIAYKTKEARDGALRSGMEKGLIPSYDRLDAILEQEPARA